MSEYNGSGIQYPEIMIAGEKYSVKFTRGKLFYRLSKAGVDLSQLSRPNNFAVAMDILHAALDPPFRGDVEVLSDLVLSEGKMLAVGEVLRDALGKVFQPPAAPVTAMETPAPQETKAQVN